MDFSKENLENKLNASALNDFLFPKTLMVLHATAFFDGLNDLMKAETSGESKKYFTEKYLTVYAKIQSANKKIAADNISFTEIEAALSDTQGVLHHQNIAAFQAFFGLVTQRLADTNVFEHPECTQTLAAWRTNLRTNRQFAKDAYTPAKNEKAIFAKSAFNENNEGKTHREDDVAIKSKSSLDALALTTLAHICYLRDNAIPYNKDKGNEGLAI